MSLSTEHKGEVIVKYRRSPKDTGSAEVQVALLSARIDGLSDHFKVHKSDIHSRRGLLKLVNQRRGLLDYLKGRDLDRYRDLIARLGLRK